MHLFFPLRSKWRAMAVAMLAAVMLTVLTAGSVLAQGHVANDGQTLEMQSPEVQAIYASVWGDNAAMQWAADHNAAIGQVAPQAQHPRYDEVFHVAYMRSMDMELAGRITADVIARGTIDQFMAGTDMGVLYGYVAPAPQPRAAPSSGGGSSSTSTSSEPSTPETSIGSGLFAGRSVSSQRLEVGVALSATTLPRANERNDRSDLGIAYAYLYALTGLPNGLNPVPVEPGDMAPTYSGMPERVGSSTVTYKVTETKTTTTPAEGETPEVVVMEMSSSTLTFTITVFDPGTEGPDIPPRFTSSPSDIRYIMGEKGYISIILPAASGGNGELMYAVSTNLPEWLSFDIETRELSGVPALTDPAVEVTYTVTDSDVGDGDTDIEMFMVAIAADTQPLLTAPTAGLDVDYDANYELTLVSDAGNVPIKYAVSGLPAGLSLNAETGVIDGQSVASGEHAIVYTATDKDGDRHSVRFTLTVADPPESN